ncbi:hypothetical protein RvY_08944 [Ramazzottius varieornatus]|uniref:EamA domain-containing protein n=1 Tax=Ramazzottius varieornatus TaxID=947166 RepID=A0A1D1VFL4_RAMVA|nr:hypothetical protein RvY_08944 [Ramazzottius varieornatus]
MAWTTFQIIVACVMLITGSLNTLIAKWTDMQVAKGRDDVAREFNHPFVQSCAMFLGEFLCLLVFGAAWLIGRRRTAGTEGDVPLVRLEGQIQEPFTYKKMLVFLPPALCDMTATSIMYVGLTMTNASSFQMLRGAVIVFTALLSVAFLHRQIASSKWLGILTVIIGLAIVGVSDMIFLPNDAKSNDKNRIITGDLLIIMAQIVSAAQMVYEEKFLTKYDVPALVAVGLEGFFGFTVLAFLLIPMAYMPAGSFSVTPYHTIEDAIDAFAQMRNNYYIVLGLCGTILSIAFFNYAGISVTKELNATTRMVIDSMRTLIIWAASLGLKWQPFNWMQIIGFGFLLIGMAVYNQIITTDKIRHVQRTVVTKIWRNNGDREVLVREDEAS